MHSLIHLFTSPSLCSSINPSIWLPIQSSSIYAPTCLPIYLFIHPSYIYLSIYPTKSLPCPPPIHLSYQSSILISLYPFIHSTIQSSTNRSCIIFFNFIMLCFIVLHRYFIFSCIILTIQPPI